MFVDIAFMAVVGGLIGWFTNYLAVKMIFRPFKPWRIPLTKFEIQGLIPKRRDEIAASIGKTVEEELILIDDLVDRLVAGENKTELIKTIKNQMLLIIEDKIPSLIPGGIRQAILSKVSEVLNREIRDFVDNKLGDIIGKAVQNINISKMVEERINSFELEEMERLILELSKRELKHIELLGGILGLIIGIVQGLLIQIF